MNEEVRDYDDLIELNYQFLIDDSKSIRLHEGPFTGMKLATAKVYMKKEDYDSMVASERAKAKAEVVKELVNKLADVGYMLETSAGYCDIDPSKALHHIGVANKHLFDIAKESLASLESGKEQMLGKEVK